MPFLADFFIVAGATLISYGCWLYSRPLGYIIGGALLLAGGFFAGYDSRQIRSVK